MRFLFKHETGMTRTVNLSAYRNENIVKNELIVQHDTIICDPYLEFTTRQSMVVTGQQNVFKFMYIYIYSCIHFTTTGYVWLFGMLVSGPSKINLKIMTGHFIWVVTGTDWYCDQK